MERTNHTHSSAHKHKIHNLHARYSISIRRKRELIKYLENLKRKYKAGGISYARYVEIIHHKKNGRTIEEWIHFYHLESLECHRKIRQHYKKLQAKKLLLILLFSALILSGIYLFYNNAGLIGFVFQEDNLTVDVQTFTEPVNKEFSESSSLTWTPGNPGKLKSVSFSGDIIGEGDAKIYLNDLLILDTSKIEEKKQITRGITGLAIGNETNDNLDSEQEVGGSRQMSPIQEDSPTSSEENSNSEQLNEEGSSQDNETGPFQNETGSSSSGETIKEPTEDARSSSEVDPPKRTFNELCQQNCNLESLNLNETSYDIIIEIEGAQTTLNLDEIKYAITFETIEESTENQTTPEEPSTPQGIRETKAETQAGTHPAGDIDLCPLDTETFVMTWCLGGADPLDICQMAVYKANGTQIDIINLSTTAAQYSVVDPGCVDNETIIVGKIEPTSEDLTIAKYSFDGSSLTLANGWNIVDGDMSDAGEHYYDVIVTPIDSTYVALGSIDNQDEDFDYNRITISDLTASTETAFHGNTNSTDYPWSNWAGTCALSSTRVAGCWYDHRTVNDFTVEVKYSATGSTIVGDPDIDSNEGTYSARRCDCLADNKVAFRR